MENKNEIIETVDVSSEQEQIQKELKKLKKYKWITSGAFALIFIALLAADIFMGWGKMLFVCASLVAWLAFVIWG